VRITPNITMQNSLYNLQSTRNLMDKTNEKIASGLNYNRPSDDPVRANMLVSLADQLRAEEQYASNVEKAAIAINMIDSPLTAMSETLTDIRSLVSIAVGGVSDNLVLENMVDQLTAYREQLADYGNTQVGDNYIFAGTKVTTMPFDRNVQDPPDSAPYYNGNDETISVELDTGVFEEINIPGSQILTGPHVNTLKTLDEFIYVLKNDPTDTASLQALSKDIYTGAQQLYNAQITTGNRIYRLESISKMLDNSKNTMLTVIGNVQNADYVKLAVQMQQQQMAFEATLSTTAKISKMSLLDYL